MREKTDREYQKSSTVLFNVIYANACIRLYLNPIQAFAYALHAFNILNNKIKINRNKKLNII